MKYNYSKQKLQKKQQKTTRQLHFIQVFYFGKDFQQNLKPDPSAMLLFQVDMIDKLLIPHFSHIDADPDVEVRKMVVEIVIGMAQGCSRDEFFDLINIIEKVWMVQSHDSCLCCKESWECVFVCVCAHV